MQTTWIGLQIIFAALGGWIGYFLGGYDGFLYALVVFVVIDYATGVMCVIAKKELSSDIGFIGIFKKVLIFVMVAVGHIIDRILIGNGEAVRTAVIFFYLSNESVSFFENASRLGLPVPNELKSALAQFHKKRGLTMIINKKLCPAGLHNNPNKPLRSVSYITIHNTGNYAPTATARNHADYQYGGSGRASWHYSVDSTEIWQSFDDKQSCWHAGNAVGNDTSIGIEICVCDKEGFVQACNNAAWLTAALLKKYKLTVDKVVQHNKWSGKNCPAELRSGAWGIDWNGFIALVKQYLGDEIKKTPIVGKAVMTAEQLATYLLKTNPKPKINCTPLELASFFIKEGETEGIRGDIAFCQSLHETGWFRFGSQVVPEQNNYSGIGAVNNSPTGKGAWFETPQIGVRAQIQHLKAYANTELLKNPCVDPRFLLVTRGTAPNWEDLNGKWVVPGGTYGQSILKLFEAGKNTKADASLIGKTDMDVAKAVGILTDNGIIGSPDYWLKNHVKLKHVDLLLINMAMKLTES